MKKWEAIGGIKNKLVTLETNPDYHVGRLIAQEMASPSDEEILGWCENKIRMIMKNKKHRRAEYYLFKSIKIRTKLMVKKHCL